MKHVKLFENWLNEGTPTALTPMICTYAVGTARRDPSDSEKSVKECKFEDYFEPQEKFRHLQFRFRKSTYFLGSGKKHIQSNG